MAPSDWRQSKAVRWPDGASSAVCLTFDIDAETMWTSRDPENERRPGVMSQAAYEIEVGIPLVLEFLRANEIRSTFFVPGWVAERHPEAIASIGRSGHEVGNHGYDHAYLDGKTPQEEETLLLRTNEILEEATGARPFGYRAPYFSITPHTFGLLRKHGFVYSSNMADSLWPYRHGGDPPLAEVPVSWGLDDGPHFLFSTHPPNYRQIFPPQAVLWSWKAEFEGIHRQGGVMTLILHPQLIARPGRLAMLQELVDHMRSFEGVWVTTALQVSEATPLLALRGVGAE